MVPQATPEPVYALPRLLTIEEVQSLVYESADRVGLPSASEMFKTVLCESPKTLVNGEVRYVVDGQSEHVRNGIREESWGLAQWNVKAGNLGLDGKPMTKEDAINAPYALDVMASYFKTGKSALWTCSSMI